MKKVFGLLGVMGIVASLAFVQAQKYNLVRKDDCGANASGFVVLNLTPTTPEGITDATIQVQVRNMAPNAVHEVRSGGDPLGTFLTNVNGNGSFHINLPAEDVLGAAINIWDAVSPAGSNGTNRCLWTTKVLSN